MTSIPHRSDLEAYALLRVRLRDFIHITLLWSRARQGVDLLADLPSHGPGQVADTLRTASLGWLASLIDPHNSAVSAFRIWPKVFPGKAARIAEVETTVAPFMDAIQAFRGSVAFHGNKSLQRQRHVEQGINAPGLGEALDAFFALAQEISEEDEKSPELASSIAQLEPNT
ncbi:MAG: hypothetical protein K8S98_02135 [Planctomycetes bacterium]|nr:hypothetical protein [Planctomycetota bacterium]